MTEFIADSKFMALRAELQEQSMLLREILKAMQSSGAPAATSAKPEAKTPKAPPKPKVPKEAVGEATVETLTGQAVEQVDTGKPVPNQPLQGGPEGTGDDAKPYPWGTPQDAPDKAEPVEMATRLPSAAEEQGAQPPAVPRRGQTLTPKLRTGEPGQAETGSRGR